MWLSCITRSLPLCASVCQVGKYQEYCNVSLSIQSNSQFFESQIGFSILFSPFMRNISNVTLWICCMLRKERANTLCNVHNVHTWMLDARMQSTAILFSVRKYVYWLLSVLYGTLIVCEQKQCAVPSRQTRILNW